MWWALFWGANKAIPSGQAGTPVLKHWNRLWARVIADPNYAKTVEAFEDSMPRSQIIIAVKESG
jgi:hypothetical protein